MLCATQMDMWLPSFEHAVSGITYQRRRSCNLLVIFKNELYESGVSGHDYFPASSG